jgi:hypothetical protein
MPMMGVHLRPLKIYLLTFVLVPFRSRGKNFQYTEYVVFVLVNGV